MICIFPNWVNPLGDNLFLPTSLRLSPGLLATDGCCTFGRLERCCMADAGRAVVLGAGRWKCV